MMNGRIGVAHAAARLPLVHEICHHHEAARNRSSARSLPWRCQFLHLFAVAGSGSARQADARTVVAGAHPVAIDAEGAGTAPSTLDCFLHAPSLNARVSRAWPSFATGLPLSWDAEASIWWSGFRPCAQENASPSRRA